MRNLAVQAVVLLSGFAALSWEIIWQHHTALTIGVSAQATAITLSAMMLGMALGSALAHRAIKRLSWRYAGQYLAFLEISIGLLGAILPYELKMLESVDVAVYRAAPGFAGAARVLGIFLVLIPPSSAMGATIPAMARLAAGHSMTIGRLYAVNLLGASIGVVGSTFLVVPSLGISATGSFTACANICAGLIFFFLRPVDASKRDEKETVSLLAAGAKHALIPALTAAFCTGCCSFALEVIWFRSLRAALQATTESFALMLFSVLAALAAGGFLSAHVKRAPWFALSRVLIVAGILVVGVVPLIERFDLFVPLTGQYAIFMLKRLLLVLLLIGPPMTVLGLALPWLLDEQADARKVGLLYAVNTLGSLTGSLGAAWILLPRFGVTLSSWIVGSVLFIAAAALKGSLQAYAKSGILAVASFVLILVTASGVGRLRAQGPQLNAVSHKVLASREGPDSTISAIELSDGTRHLVVDGMIASGEGGHYMSWMGRLPMLLHPDPRDALVICFGTGETANAVMEEKPRSLDVVDVSPAVFEIAPIFRNNRGVLKDSRCRQITMDGRAWLRRTDRQYDVITLEPMPPTLAGSNSLYSIEFYQALRSRLREGGIATQWMPLHLVDPAEGAAIAATFYRVFQDVDVSVDPVDGLTTILVGYKRTGPRSSDSPKIGNRPGSEERKLAMGSMIGSYAVARFAEAGKVITDDNQLLTYGYGRMKWWGVGSQIQRQQYGVKLLIQAGRR